MLSIAGDLLDICPLSFSNLWDCMKHSGRGHFIFTGQRCMEWATWYFTLLQHIFYALPSSERLCVAPDRLRDCYTRTLGLSVLSTMQLQRMAWKQQPKWRYEHVLASDGNQLCYFKYCGAFGGDGAGHNMFFVFLDSSMAAHRVQWWSVLWKLSHADLNFGTAQGYSSPVSWS